VYLVTLSNNRSHAVAGACRHKVRSPRTLDIFHVENYSITLCYVAIILLLRRHTGDLTLCGVDDFKDAATVDDDDAEYGISPSMRSTAPCPSTRRRH